MKRQLKSLIILSALSLLLTGCNGGGSTSTTSGSTSSSSTTTSVDPGDYYASITESMSGDALKNALNELNTSKRKRKIGYDGFKTYFQYTEIDWNGTTPEGKMVGFYDNSYVNNYWDNEKTWNREHVWPNSLGGSKVEGDIFMPRPTNKNLNSERGNKFYGESSSTYDAGKYVKEYRGVAARIVFYCAIADTSLKVIDTDGTAKNSMGRLSTLLKWNLAYMPSKDKDANLALRVEQNRNDVVQKRSDGQGNRNPFVDHPEYACRIWGTTNSETRKICGM